MPAGMRASPSGKAGSRHGKRNWIEWPRLSQAESRQTTKKHRRQDFSAPSRTGRLNATVRFVINHLAWRQNCIRVGMMTIGPLSSLYSRSEEHTSELQSL